ncbi:Mariner Mos1 transposase [Eumeta japonica]|uniref:Mariner Mos1 transposase n=1 Tax=Eumeta variegata TaxID=151549 RepID=A0A4C1ZY20_EUMVA|nr:Mariner Mos1 transposase [Eumeta japonica]
MEAAIWNLRECSVRLRRCDLAGRGSAAPAERGVLAEPREPVIPAPPRDVKPSTSVAKQDIHGCKLLLCIWWDQRGVIYYELLKSNDTITGDRYRLQLIRLSRALKEKRSEYRKRHDKVILLHDNVRPHVAKPVKTYLGTLKWDVLPHPPYSPDIKPSDYHLFRSMAHGLTDQKFTSYEDFQNSVDMWISSKDKEFFQRGIRLLSERWQKVVESYGKYFE